MTEKIYCEKCGRELEESEVHELDGQILCESCFNEEEDFRGLEEEWF